MRRLLDAITTPPLDAVRLKEQCPGISWWSAVRLAYALYTNGFRRI